MKKGILLGLMTAMMLVMSLAVTAIGPTWDITGTWNMDFVLLPGGGHYIHTMVVNSFNPATGEFSGTGFYNPNPGYTWVVSGDVTGTIINDAITFQIVYTGLNPGYTVNGVGTIAADGKSMSGTATGPGQSFTWTGTGTATAVVDTCPTGTATEKVETITVPSTSSVATPSSNVLLSGKNYLLVSSGTWTNVGKNVADTEFASIDNWATHMDGYNIDPYFLGEGEFDLQIDGAFVNWAGYNSAHTYSHLYTGTGSAVNFLIFDGDSTALPPVINPGWYGDNSGSLSVDIFYCVPDNDGDGYGSNDCNDNDANIHPGATEVCDGVDNDCDTTVDEDLNQLTSNQNGECTGNTETCAAGAWLPDVTNYVPVDEICNGLDDDCDASVDEDLVAPLADNQNGVCAGSVKVCDGVNEWIAYYTLIADYEDPEVSCDTFDNNCDGVVDQHVCNWFCVPTTEVPPTEGLGVNRHAVISGKGWSKDYFTTLSSKNVKGVTTFYQAQSIFSLDDTNGCSCSQILTQLNKYNPEIYGNMEGHWKFGCSKGVMEEFTRLVVPEPIPVDTVTVLANDVDGMNSAVSFTTGDKLFIKSRGMYYWTTGWAADTEWQNRATAGPWGPVGWISGNLTPAPWTHGLDLIINGIGYDWIGSYLGPADTNEYTLDYTVPASGTLNFKILDDNYGDNSGSLTVNIYAII